MGQEIAAEDQTAPRQLPAAVLIGNAPLPLAVLKPADPALPVPLKALETGLLQQLFR